MQVKALHVHASLVYPFVQFAADCGNRVEHLMDKSGLPTIDYAEADSTVPEKALCDFLLLCAKSDFTLEFGLDSAAASRPEHPETSGRIEGDMSSWSVLKRICEEKNRLCPYPRYWLERDGESSWLCRGPHIAPFDIRDIELFAVHRLIDIVRALTGSNFSSPEIRLKTSEIGRIRSYPLFGNSRLLTGSSHTRIAIPHELLMEPSRMPPDDDFLAAVRTHLETVKTGNRLPRIDDLCASMAISRRNLQRLLRERSTSFRILHDELIFRSAKRIWQSGDASTVDVATELGYASHANFNRAITRIVGVTPTEFRNHVRAETDANVVHPRLFWCGTMPEAGNLWPAETVTASGHRHPLTSNRETRELSVNEPEGTSLGPCRVQFQENLAARFDGLEQWTATNTAFLITALVDQCAGFRFVVRFRGTFRALC